MPNKYLPSCGLLKEYMGRNIKKELCEFTQALFADYWGSGKCLVTRRYSPPLWARYSEGVTP